MNKKIAQFLPAFILFIIGLSFVIWKSNSYEAAPTEKFVTVSGTAVIKMGDDSYSPQNIQIKKGSKVQFVNSASSLRWPASDLHPSHLIFPEFDPKEPIGIGSTWEYTFDKVGSWGYHDHLAPYITGTIRVVE